MASQHHASVVPTYAKKGRLEAAIQVRMCLPEKSQGSHAEDLGKLPGPACCFTQKHICLIPRIGGSCMIMQTGRFCLSHFRAGSGSGGKAGIGPSDVICHIYLNIRKAGPLPRNPSLPKNGCILKIQIFCVTVRVMSSQACVSFRCSPAPHHAIYKPPCSPMQPLSTSFC